MLSALIEQVKQSACINDRHAPEKIIKRRDLRNLSGRRRYRLNRRRKVELEDIALYESNGCLVLIGIELVTKSEELWDEFAANDLCARVPIVRCFAHICSH